MKIALATYAMHTGGMETFILALAEGLWRAGHEVHIVVTDERGKWFSRAAEAGAEAHFIDGLAATSRADHARRVGRFLRDAGFDVVINNSSLFVQASLGMLADRVTAISVIHNTAPAVVTLACANERPCNAFVAPSQAIFDDATALLTDRGKLRLIPHGIPVPDLPPERPPADGLIVLYCGRLEDSQKQVLLLPGIVRRALDSGVRLRLDIVGDGPDRERLAESIARGGLTAAMPLRGELDHAASLKCFGRSDALLMPSSYEGLPIALLEAMARGCIPVVSRLPGITDRVIEHERTGFLVEPGDVDGFARPLARLAQDSSLRHAMRRAAWQSARERFRLERMVADYLALIDRWQEQPFSRRGLPEVSPDCIRWKDRLPPRWRKPLGRLRRAILTP